LYGGIFVALTITSREVDAVTVLDLSGQITLGNGSVQLRDAIRSLLGQGAKNVLLNLEGVNLLDSSGLGELVSAFTAVKKQQGQLKLLHPAQKVHHLLQITKVDTVLDIKDDEASALASFKH
jgi:anti-sigma B factor antagonist